MNILVHVLLSKRASPTGKFINNRHILGLYFWRLRNSSPRWRHPMNTFMLSHGTVPAQASSQDKSTGWTNPPETFTHPADTALTHSPGVTVLYSYNDNICSPPVFHETSDHSLFLSGCCSCNKRPEHKLMLKMASGKRDRWHGQDERFWDISVSIAVPVCLCRSVPLWLCRDPSSGFECLSSCFTG